MILRIPGRGIWVSDSHLVSAEVSQDLGFVQLVLTFVNGYRLILDSQEAETIRDLLDRKAQFELGEFENLEKDNYEWEKASQSTWSITTFNPEVASDPKGDRA